MARLTLTETMNRLLLLTRAGHPVIYIRSHEEARVQDYLAKMVRVMKKENPNKSFLRWYEGTGLEELRNLSAYDGSLEGLKWLDVEGVPLDVEGAPETHAWRNTGGQDALNALNAIKVADMTANPVLGDSLIVFFDLHPYLRQDALISSRGSLVRPLRNTADSLRRYYDRHRGVRGSPYKTLIIVAPSTAGLSVELERDVIVIDFPLPETDELLQTLIHMLLEEDARQLYEVPNFGRGILRFPEPIPEQEIRAICGSHVEVAEYKKRLCELISGSGRGLTIEDYKRGLNMFAVLGQGLCAQHIEEMLHLKATGINNQALQYTPHVEINLGGLEGIKEWILMRRDAVVSKSVREKYHLPPPKGILFCGVSGGGKSQLAKLIAKEFNLALLRLDVGALFGMYVGESEERTRQALQMAEVLAPVVLWLDEVDKAFTGVSAGGDNGVSARVFGHFLTWLAEKQDSVFVVATANDFREMLTKFPEFGRKGRFDEIFWVDMPDAAARQSIFRIYLEPLFREGYLHLTEDEIFRLAMRENLLEQPQGKDVLDKFGWILSQPNISNNMTGAEIEYAVNDALYRVYHQAQQHPQTSEGLTAEFFVNTVKANMERTLYRPGSPDYEVLNRLRAEAVVGKRWPLAGNPPAEMRGGN